MKIIGLLPFFGFLLFCSQILYRFLQLKNAGVTVSKKKSKLNAVFNSIILSAFLIVFLVEILSQSYIFSFSFLPNILHQTIIHSTILSISGSIIIILSLVGMQFTLVSFKYSLRFGLDSNNLGELVTNGIFAYSRNPFFCSIMLFFFGCTMVFPNPFFATTAVLSFVSIHLYILREEKFMQKNYGEEYRKYAQKVRRYF